MYKKCTNFANVKGSYSRLEDEKQFIQAVSGEGFIVILDNANGDEVHLPKCSLVKLESFSKKVVENQGSTGCYFWCGDYDYALHTFGARDCAFCMR
jgi:hypothetical protein